MREEEEEEEEAMGAQRKGATRVSEDSEELARVPLQAILLADSFATKFRPITLERPKVYSLSLRTNTDTPMHTYIYITICVVIMECSEGEGQSG